MRKIFAALTLASTLLPLIAVAQPQVVITELQDVIDLIDKAASWIYSIIMGVAVIVILVGAFLFMTAGGDPEKIASARGWIIGGIIGVAVALLSRALIGLITIFVTG